MNYQIKDIAAYRQIMEQYRTGSLLAKVVAGFDYSDEEIASFFHEQDYSKPLNEEPIRKIKDILTQASVSGEKVFIYGDYDCDGICATTIMAMILEKLKVSYGYYIPNRFIEGYGLNLERLQQAWQKGYRILITVDNGVRAHDALKWAKEAGMTVIVTDHHEMDEEVECDVLCHPAMLPQGYQYLCGGGITYVIAEQLGLLDDKIRILGMLATIGDVMEMKGKNLTIIREGLKLVNRRVYYNFDQLGADFRYPVDEGDIGFKISPRINAVGRLVDIANPNQLVKYFLSDNQKDIEKAAREIIEVNETRKKLTASQLSEISGDIDEQASFLIVTGKQLHEGLVGLIAGRLSDDYHRPALVLSESGDLLKGSARCQENDSLIELFEPYKDRLIAYGGHKQACGLTLEKQQLPELKAYIESNYQPKEIPLKPAIQLDFRDLTEENLAELFSYSPFGQGRKILPLRVKLENIRRYQTLNNEKYLKWSCLNGNSWISVLSFGNNRGYDYYRNKTDITVTGSLRKNIYGSRISYDFICDEVEAL